MSNLKNFVGEKAYNVIKNIAVDNESLRAALVTPQNARNVFSELTDFEIKSLCFEISSCGVIGKTRNTTKQEIIDAFNSVGYDTVIFDDEEAIAECKKYYKQNEVICTYGDLGGRLKQYYMIVAIKKDIDKIKRHDTPKREDDYGTSILNIQIAKNGSHMSIKNRYNHTVSQPDSTFNNNLDFLCQGLQAMVLGYYGFASLKKDSSYYNHIVNIGNVYLKYHTEINNIYVGAFLLDSKNGVRFKDTSRYYVSPKSKFMGNAHSYLFFNSYPAVLDFKGKEAIDFAKRSYTHNFTDKKIPLLSRAMKENLLTSENKENVHTLSAVFPNAKKELLQCKRNALQTAHNFFGYDFTKPYTVTGILGNFTAKSIEKATGHNSGVLFLALGDDMKICLLKRGGFLVTDNDFDKVNYSSRGLPMFYSKQHFENIRKSGETALYVVQQDEQYIQGVKRKNEDFESIRYDDIIDKNGCNLTKNRRSLEIRLNNYKTNKRKKEVSEIDYSSDLAEILKSLAELKAEALKLLEKAKTKKDYALLQDFFDFSCTWLVSDIQTFEEKVVNNSFKSILDATTTIENIKNRINTKKKILKQ